MNAKVLMRVQKISDYILKTKSTVRATAIIYGVSKSTVHNDIHKRLPKINLKKFKKIDKIMQSNFEEKHLRGGNATKEKYANNKLLKNKI